MDKCAILKSLMKNCLAKRVLQFISWERSSNKEYQNVLKIRDKFETKTIRDYHDLYLKWNVLLFADVFEKFRNRFPENYGLCPSHHLGETALSWDAMLSMTKIEPDLISDVGMYLFFEKGMGSCLSYISKDKRHF